MTSPNAVAARPPHIPEDAVYDFDMFLDAGLRSDPHERVRTMLKEAPAVFWTPRNGGHWVATSYKAVFQASRDAETFSSQLISSALKSRMMAMLPAGAPHIPQPTPINMDPPEHTKYRAPLNFSFSPKAVMARREEIRILTDSLIDAVIDRGQCDFIKEIAEPLPVHVFLKIMGLPVERLPEFRILVREFLAPGAHNPIEAIRRMRMIADALKECFEARRVEPKDDLISLLWNTEVDGNPMTLERMEDYGVLLFIGGLDTVINSIGYAMRHLAVNPELQNELRANPTLIADASEEMLRRYTFTVPVRRVTKNAELGGRFMKEDDRLMLYLPAADLDPAEFSAPEQYDLNREHKSHIAFGVGPHRCLGSHLARLELQVVYQQMLARVPMFRLDDSTPIKFQGGHTLAMENLPLRWD